MHSSTLKMCSVLQLWGGMLTRKILKIKNYKMESGGNFSRDIARNVHMVRVAQTLTCEV